MLDPIHVKERLLELEKDVEPLAEEKRDLEARVTRQETKTKIVEMLAYNATEKQAEKTRKSLSLDTWVEYRNEKTTWKQELEILADLEASLQVAKGKWESLQESRWILQSILGYDRETIKFMS